MHIRHNIYGTAKIVFVKFRKLANPRKFCIYPRKFAAI